MAKARRVLRQLLKLGWQISSQKGSHRKLTKPGYPPLVFAFHDNVEIGPVMLARIAKDAGCRSEDLT
jgi:predicted RNA binding protein YcfA (HicA-like mRNA interferase family)